MRSTQFLRQMSGAFEQVVQNCWKRKKKLKACWKCVESNLNWLKLHLILLQHFVCFWKCWMALFETVWTLRSSNICPTSVQLFSCTNVGQMLKHFKLVFSVLLLVFISFHSILALSLTFKEIQKFNTVDPRRRPIGNHDSNYNYHVTC